MEDDSTKNLVRRSPVFESEILSDRSSADVDVTPQLKGALQDAVHVQQVGLQVMALAWMQEVGAADKILEFSDAKLGHDASDLVR